MNNDNSDNINGYNQKPKPDKKYIFIAIGVALFILSLALMKRGKKEPKKIRTIKITKTKTITPKGEENDETIEDDDSEENGKPDDSTSGKPDDSTSGKPDDSGATE